LIGFAIMTPKPAPIAFLYLIDIIDKT